MKEIKLQSGAVLKITGIPFADAKAVYQAILEEATRIGMNAETDVAKLIQQIFCVSFSSKKIDTSLWKCFERCIYSDSRGDLKIDKDTFEPVGAREDYMAVCMEVAIEAVGPFLKNLSAVFGRIQTLIVKSPA